MASAATVAATMFWLARGKTLGLIADPRGHGHYMVSHLRPTSSEQHTTLVYYSTETDAWAVKELGSSPHHPPWGSHGGVVTHDEKLWWVDLPYGILTCDPFLDRPDLRYVALPEGRVMSNVTTRERGDLDMHRCVKASEGKLRYVEILGVPGQQKVSMWTLADPEGPVWIHEYEVFLETIWADESHLAAGLPPQKVPAIALIHPKNHGVIYFFQGARLFAVNMLASERRVLECETSYLELYERFDVFHTARFVHAWELPPTLLPFHPSRVPEADKIQRKSKPSWVIMDSVPEVDSDMEREPNVLVLKPPGESVIRAPRGYFGHDAKIIASDPSGALLLASSYLTLVYPLPPDSRQYKTDEDEPAFAMVRVGCRAQPIHAIADLGNVGVIASPDDSGYMIVELQLIKHTQRARLISTRMTAWSEQELDCPVPLPHRAWGGHGVIPHDGKLWWIDLSWGLLSCNIFSDQPEIAFQELPEGSLLEFADPYIHCRRCIAVSDNKLRYVDVIEGNNPRTSKVHVWTYDGGRGWRLDYEVRFSNIWDDRSYHQLPLLERVPALVLLHPFRPGVIYLMVAGNTFAVDLSTEKLIEHRFGQYPHGRSSWLSQVKKVNPRLAWTMPSSVPVLEGAWLSCRILTRDLLVPAEPTMASQCVPSWVILGRTPEVRNVEGGAALSLAFVAPPRVTLAAFHPGAFPYDHPAVSIRSADNSTGLLLVTSREKCQNGQDVHIFDSAHGSATDLGLKSSGYELYGYGHSLGLLSYPAINGNYMVVQLQLDPLVSGSEASLLCFSSAEGNWFKKKVRHPLPERRFFDHGVLSYQGKICWFDMSWGILICNPADRAPVLRFIPLPPGAVIESMLSPFRHRLLTVSAGKLRFVDTYSRSNEPEEISLWTLPSLESRWELEQMTRFDEIWADDSYRATGLPKKIPVPALIHPKNPYVVYFFLEEHLFGVDVRARMVVECQEYNLVEPQPLTDIFESPVQAWELPASALIRASGQCNSKAKLCNRLYRLA